MSCQSKSVVFGKTKIKVGREFFETNAEHCSICNKVAISPKLQKQIDEWALQFTKSIIEIQPFFSKKMSSRIEFYARSFNLNKSEFMKLCTAFYLLEMTRLKNFKTLRENIFIESQKIFNGEKSKICVSIKYQLFKKITLYAEMWNLEYESNVMEEAVQFCIFILDNQSGMIEESKKIKLVNFVEYHAMAS